MRLSNLVILAQTPHEIYSNEAGGFDIFDHFLTIANRSDVISGTVNQDIGMDVCASFGDSRLKPS